MFSCIKRERPLLLPTHWLALYSVSFCSHRNTLFSDITDLEQTLVSETLCPYPHPKSSGLTVLGEAPPTPTHDMCSCLSPVRLSVPGGLCWKTEVPCAGGGLTLIYLETSLSAWARFFASENFNFQTYKLKIMIATKYEE